MNHDVYVALVVQTTDFCFRESSPFGHVARPSITKRTHRQVDSLVSCRSMCSSVLWPESFEKARHYPGGKILR